MAIVYKKIDTLSTGFPLVKGTSIINLTLETSFKIL